MAIEFTNLVGDWRRIVEDYVTDPANAADAPGVEGTITVSPVLGEGRHAPRGVPSGGVFYTFAPLDLRVYRGLLRDENLNSDITVAIEVDGYPIAWRAKFDLQYRRVKIPLQDVIFGPDEIVAGQISLSSLVARDGVPPEYEGSYVQLMDAVAQAAGHAATAGAAAALIEANLPAINAAPGHAQRAEDAATDAAESANSFDITATATTGAAGSNATVTVTGDGPAYGLAFTVPRGDKGDRGDDGEVSQAALDAAVASLVDGAPEALDTLTELAAALGDDPNFATTMATAIGERVKDDDPRLTDARTPTVHTHPVSELDTSGTASYSTYLRGDGTWASPHHYRNVRDYGAVGDGVADDHAAIMAALDAADAAGGGVVYFPPGDYSVSAPVGRLAGTYANLTLVCDAQASARVFSSGDFPPVAGAWFRCRIALLMFDAALHGSPAMNIHMAESVVSGCLFDGWNGSAVRLNDGTYGDVGLLNRFEYNHIVQLAGIGIFQTYRWVDSWIVGNNVGSSGANLSLEGGPVRVVDNHFNGAPEYNIVLRGNKRVTIINNICEGSRKEAIIYEMPPWLTDDDAQVLISNNNISNGGKGSPGTYQAIRLEGVTGTTGLSGFSIFGNIFACEDAGSGWSHAVGLHNTKQVALLANVWEKGYTVSPYLLADGSPAPRSVGNTSGNIIPVSDLNTTGTASSTTYLRGDGSWATPPSTAAEVGAVTRQGAATGLWVGTESSLPATGTAGVLYVTTE